MSTRSPMHKLHEQAEAHFIPYGPLPGSQGDVLAASAPDDEATDGSDGTFAQLVSTYGEIEAEYAALRKGAGLVDLPTRGIIEVTGSDRHAFLNSMLTNPVDPMKPGDVVPAFWLNRKGRIVSDLTVVELGDRMLIELDVLTVSATLQSLEQYLFAEDVVLRDVTESMHRLDLHGPRAAEVLNVVLGSVLRQRAGGVPDELSQLGQRTGCQLELPEHEAGLAVYRDDILGEPGYHLICPCSVVAEFYERLKAATESRGFRAVGWHACNIARIESGTPAFLVDFGPDSLPHETGILRDRVSFTKGCYLGQEVVARMESLGKPKKTLAGLKLKSELLPGSGGQVYDPDDTMGEVIGAVTSATPSPMLGNTVIAFAMLKYAKASPGATVVVNAEGERVEAEVHPLRFWTKP